jgi:hypothetical protein
MKLFPKVDNDGNRIDDNLPENVLSYTWSLPNSLGALVSYDVS